MYGYPDWLRMQSKNRVQVISAVLEATRGMVFPIARSVRVILEGDTAMLEADSYLQLAKGQNPIVRLKM